MKTIRIPLDADFDLQQVSYADVTDEQIEDFEEAFLEAAEYIGECEGIEIRVDTETNYDLTVMDEEEQRIWQDCHNCIEQIGPREYRFVPK